MRATPLTLVKTLVKTPANKLAKIAFISSLSLAFTASYAESDEPSFATQQVSEGIYMLSGATGFTGGNIVVSMGVDGVAIIDNGVASVLDKLRAEIAKLTDQPVDYLINTHVHGDHIGNNAAFGEAGTTLVSHRNLRTTLVEKGVGRDEFKAAPESALPEITFSDEMTLNLNGEAVRLIHLSDAHTNGDSVIHFTNSNVIHTGDIMFNGRFPYIDAGNGGSLDGAIAALSKISDLANAETKIVPGHGPMANKEDVNKTIAMLKDAKQRVADLVAQGKSDEDILSANPLADYADFDWGFISTERMIKQLILAVRG